LIIDIWNLFVICFLLFGALIQNLSDFMDEHYLVNQVWYLSFITLDFL